MIGLLSRAFSLLSQQRDLKQLDAIEHIAESLTRLSQHQMAGTLYERIGQSEEALTAYIAANAYSAAIELCRRSLPEKVAHVQEVYTNKFSFVHF